MTQHDVSFASQIDWSAFRAEMPVVKRWLYLDHAAVAPLPASARDAISDWANEAASDGDTAWPRWKAAVDRLRGKAAALIGAAPEEVAIIKNTTEGINIIALGYPWQKGDNVVLPADEFPTNQYPWIQLASQGVEVRRIEPGCPGRLYDAIREACDGHTRIITISWVNYATGFRVDLDRLAELARDVGALLFVDAIQGLGVFPLDVRQIPIDFLAADGHKWLLGPEGAGLFFCRHNHLERLRPVGIGWNSVVHASDYSRIELNLKPSVARYEGGSYNMVGVIGLEASLSLLQSFGVQRLASRILEVTDWACELLRQHGARIHSERDGEHRSGIVSFEFPGVDPALARRRCLEHGVVLSSRGGRLRISPHAYNTEEDIERLIEALTLIRKQGG